MPDHVRVSASSAVVSTFPAAAESTAAVEEAIVVGTPAYVVVTLSSGIGSAESVQERRKNLSDNLKKLRFPVP